MKRLRSLLLCVALLSPAQAWNGPGHKVVALIAASELSEQSQARLAEMLKHHPFPEARELLGASVWPDQIKAYPDYARGTWHYANVPFFPEGQVLETEDQGLIVPALQQNLDLLRSETASSQDKAVALAWVIHLAGDLHQPLHAITSYSSDLPQGDRGGNEWKVRYLQEETNLHSFWDSAGGLFWKGRNGQDLSEVATALKKLAPADVMLGVTDPDIWKYESHLLGRYFAYPQSGQNAELSTCYVEQARQISQARLAVAGRRLALMLEDVLASPKR